MDYYLRNILEEIKKNPRLSEEETNTLAIAAKAGDLASEKKILESHLYLSTRIAMQYKFKLASWNTHEFGDLVSEAYLGLRKALNGFEPEKGGFSKRAFFCVKQHIDSQISKSSSSLHIPERLRQKLSRLKDIDELNPEIIAEKLGVKYDTAKNIFNILGGEHSLNIPSGDNDDERINSLPSNSNNFVDIICVKDEMLRALEPLIAHTFGGQNGNTRPKIAYLMFTIKTEINIRYTYKQDIDLIHQEVNSLKPLLVLLEKQAKTEGCLNKTLFKSQRSIDELTKSSTLRDYAKPATRFMKDNVVDYGRSM